MRKRPGHGAAALPGGDRALTMTRELTRYEIFLSYARADNRPIPPAEMGWVATVLALTRRL